MSEYTVVIYDEDSEELDTFEIDIASMADVHDLVDEPLRSKEIAEQIQAIIKPHFRSSIGDD